MNPYQNTSKTKKTLTLIGIYISLVFNIVEATSASTLLSAASAAIGGAEYFSLTTTLKGAAAVVFLALFGFMSARKPEQKPIIFSASMLVAGVAILVRAIAPNMWIIVGTGIMTAVVSGACMVVGYSLIRDMYGSVQAGVLLGLCATVNNIGKLVGPTALGFVTDMFGWRASYHVLWPLAVISAVLVIVGARITKEEGAQIARNSAKFDGIGAIALTVFSIPIVLVISLGTSRIPFGSAGSWALIAVAVVGLAVLLFDMKKKGDNAIVPTSVIRDRNTIMLTMYLSISGFSSMAITYFIPTFVMRVMGGTAAQAGLTSSVRSILGLFICPFIGAWLAKTMKARTMLSLNTILGLVISFGLIFLLAPDSSFVVMLVLMLLYGIVESVRSVATSAVPQLIIDKDIRVVSNSFIQVVNVFFTNLGTATFASIIAKRGVQDGFPVAMWVSAAAVAVSIIFALGIKKVEIKQN